MQNFELISVARIVFGVGQVEQLGQLCSELGKNALLVTNAGQLGDGGLVDSVCEILAEAEIDAACYRQRGEPTVDDVDRALELARAENCDVVIGLGGGSAIDAAKAAAGLLANGGSALDYMEVIGQGKKITQLAMPWIAVPTTAGTGAEVTKNAVIGCPEKSFKASIRSELLLPKIALVDPGLARKVPSAITARSGMDALCQLIESYTSNRSQPVTDALALEGIRRAATALPRAFADGDDLEAREEMALAALLSGITLTNVGLGAVHGFAAPAGAGYPIPHGAVCALLLPPVVRANATVARAECDQHPLLEKYATVGRLMTGLTEITDAQAIEAGIVFLEDLVSRLEIPRLRHFNFQPESLPELVRLAKKSSSMRYNPVTLSDESLLEILHQAW